MDFLLQPAIVLAWLFYGARKGGVVTGENKAPTVEDVAKAEVLL